MTTTRDPRKQRGADVRATVLEVALRLFARNGYAGVSMREVALEVGFTQAAIYYHFSDKIDLYRHAVDHAIKQVTDSIEEVVRIQDGTPPERLRRVIARIIGRFSSNNDGCILFQRVLIDTDRENALIFAAKPLKRFFDLMMGFAAELGVTGDRRRWVLSLCSLCFMPYEGRMLIERIPGAGPGLYEEAEMIEYVAGLLEVHVSPR